MPTSYRLFRLQPDNVTQAELIDTSDSERNIARAVFRRWPVATCMPCIPQDGPDRGSMIITVWETADDALKRRTPVALVRTVPSVAGFKQQLWATPVSA